MMKLELNYENIVACAYAQYGRERFTSRDLAIVLCDVLELRRTVSTIASIHDRAERLVNDGWLIRAPGPRGGQAYAVSEAGLEAVKDIEVPLERFASREQALDEREREASANAGELFDLLYGALNRYDGAWGFMRSVEYQWLTAGWVSQKQALALASIAAGVGQPFDPALYVGRARPEWIAQYRAAEEAAQLAEQQRVAALQARREEETARCKKAAVRNQQVKAVLETIYANPEGKLAGLPALMASVFPDRSVTAGAITAAFRGGGSQAMRTCISAMAFGVPPNRIWADATRGATSPQPDADSEPWQTLIAHPAGAAYKEVAGGGDPIES